MVGLNTTYAAAWIENSQAENGFGNSILTLTGSGSYSWSGHIRNTGTGSGTLGLTMAGSGVQTLSGTGIAYTGPTLVSSGQLILFNATAYNSPTTISSGAKLSWSGNATSQNSNTGDTIALNSGGTLEDINPANWTVIDGAVTASGTTTINESSNATGSATSGFFLDGGLKGSGTVTINATNAGNAVNFRNNNSTFNGTLIVNGIASTTAFAGSGIGVGGATTGLQNADIQLNGTMELLNQGIGWANVGSGAFKMGALSGTGVMVGNFTSGGLTTVTLGNTGNSGSFSGIIANGTGNVVSLVKIGAGVQTFSGTNTYTGSTTISNGTLQLGNGGTTGSLSTSSIITDNGTLAFNRSNAVIQGTDFSASPITGSGGVSQLGAGTTTLTAANTYSGGTTINAGTLSVAAIADTNAGTSNIGYSSGPTSNILTLGGGTLQYTGAGSSTTGRNVTLAAPGTIVVSGGASSNLILNGTISDGTSGYGLTLGAGSSGTLTLGGANAYGGNTTVNGGTLRIANGANGSAIGTGATLTIADGAAFGGNGTIGSFANPVAVTLGTAGGAGATLWPGTGTNTPNALVVNGSLTLQGTGPTLRFNLSSSTSSGNDTLTVNNSALTLPNAATLNLNLLSGLLGTGTYQLATAATLSAPANFNSWTISGARRRPRRKPGRGRQRAGSKRHPHRAQLDRRSRRRRPGRDRHGRRLGR